jgi:hypothetical protein
MWIQPKAFFESARTLAAAQSVIAMRMAVLAGGGPRAGHEFVRMVTEKSILAHQLAFYGIAATMLGSSASEILGKSTKAVGTKVRANRRRLERRSR